MLRRVLCGRKTGTILLQRIFSDVNLSKKIERSEFGNRNKSGFSPVEESEDALIEAEKLEKDVEKLIESLRKLEDAVPIIGSGLIKDATKKLSVEEMESPDDTTSRSVQWRPIIYNEGELDKSDLSKPPSQANPHPFDLTNPEIAKVLPPTHARSISAFVNHSKVLQNLLDLGVDLLEIDIKTKLGRHILRMDWEKDVLPKLAWLVKTLEIDQETLGNYLTRNPFFLIQNLDDIQTRFAYLESKKFTTKQISKIAIENRFWLNMDVKTIDARLGWIQKQFHLSGNRIRDLIVMEPRLIQFGLGPIQRILLLFNNELAFTPAEIRKMLLEDPRVFMMDYQHLVATYNYLALTMQISNSRIAEFPMALRCTVSAIRKRHEFLKRLHKAIYDPELPNSISLKDLLQPSDQLFAEKVGRVKIDVYNRYLKTL